MTIYNYALDCSDKYNVLQLTSHNVLPSVVLRGHERKWLDT